MQLTITLTGEANPDIVQSLIAGLNGVTSSVTPAETKPTKKAAAKPAKAEKKETAKEPEEAEEATDTADAPRFEDIRKAVHAKATAGKKKEIVALLDEFGATTVPKLEKAQYADFYQKVQEL